ncbi:MAG: flagellar M-ring protein FliF C-terminal domain-containing protein [Vulcanimicrobiaceae bacterium]
MRLVAAGIALVAVVAAFAIAFYLRSDGTALFPRSLDADQISEVAARLTEWDIPFTVTPDNVKVDLARKRDISLRLAMVGVPHPHVATSSESLQAVNALTPQALLDAQERTGLEGDLALGLRGITGVSDARVKIAPASHGVFIDEASHDASASVFLTLDSGVKLAPEAVRGIRSYVAGAVPGLAPGRVGVIDQNGDSLTARALSGGGSEDTGLETTLQGALDRTIGPGESFVLAHIETDSSTSTQRDVKRVPLAAQAIADSSVREHYRGKDKSYDKVRESIDRGSETVETTTQVGPGSPKRLSVAVFVDQARAALIPRIREVLAAGAGINPERGDKLVVQAIAFAHPPAPIFHPQPPAQFASILPSLPYLFVGLASVLVLAILGSSFASRHASSAEQVERGRQAVADFEPERIYARLRGEPPHSAAAILSALPAATTAAVLEFYTPEARRDLVHRLSRPMPPIVRDLGASARLV